MPRGLWVLLCELPFLPIFPHFFSPLSCFDSTLLTDSTSTPFFASRWDLIDEKLGEKTGAQKGDTIKKYTGELIALKRTSTPEVSFFYLESSSPKTNPKKKKKRKRNRKRNKKKRKNKKK